MLIQLLFNRVLSLGFEAAYLDNYCEGPPRTLSIFPDRNNSELFRDFYNRDFNSHYCGSLPYLINRGCCMATLYPRKNDYNSAQYFFGDTIMEADFPITSNGNRYCSIEAESISENFPFLKKLILRSSDCIDGIICTNEHIQFFADKSCKPKSFEYSLGTEKKIINIWNQRIHLQLFDVSYANQKKIWVQYVPTSAIAPDFTRTMDFVGIVSILLAMLMSILVFVYFLALAWVREPGSIKLALIQIAWLVWVIMELCYWVLVFPNNLSWQILNESQGVVYNIVSLVGTIESTLTLLHYFAIPKEKYYRWIIGLIFIHIILSGGNYILLLLYVESTTVFTTYWTFGYPFWNMFQFSLNTFPPVYMCIRLAQFDMDERQEKSMIPSFMRMWNISWHFFVLLGIQFINTIAYGYLYIIYCLTNVAGDDLTWNSLIGPICLTNVVHEVINCAISLLIKKIILKVKHPDASFQGFSPVTRLRIKLRKRLSSSLNDKNHSKNSNSSLPSSKSIRTSKSLNSMKSKVILKSQIFEENSVNEEKMNNFKLLEVNHVPMDRKEFNLDPLGKKVSQIKTYSQSEKLIPHEHEDDLSYKCVRLQSRSHRVLPTHVQIDYTVQKPYNSLSRTTNDQEEQDEVASPSDLFTIPKRQHSIVTTASKKGSFKELFGIHDRKKSFAPSVTPSIKLTMVGAANTDPIFEIDLADDDIDYQVHIAPQERKRSLSAGNVPSRFVKQEISSMMRENSAPNQLEAFNVSSQSKSNPSNALLDVPLTSIKDNNKPEVENNGNFETRKSSVRRKSFNDVLPTNSNTSLSHNEAFSRRFSTSSNEHRSNSLTPTGGKSGSNVSSLTPNTIDDTLFTIPKRRQSISTKSLKSQNSNSEMSHSPSPSKGRRSSLFGNNLFFKRENNGESEQHKNPDDSTII